MACNNAYTVFWAGVSFSGATQLYTDSNLTTVAPDGWYQEGGVYRQIIGGVLGAATPCPDCGTVPGRALPCDTTISASAGQGEYRVSFDAGISTGAIIVVFNPAQVPDKCTWTYDGVSASEYSSSGWGYMQGIIGHVTAANCNGDPITNLNGSNGVSYGGTVYEWDFGLPGFVSTGVPTTLGPYTPERTVPCTVGGTTLVAGSPGNTMMVVPKPNISPSIVEFVLEGPCGGTYWTLNVRCPHQLNRFDYDDVPSVCGAGFSKVLYTASPSSPVGITTTISLYDWVFEDVNGVTLLAAGNYKVNNVGTGTIDCITVSCDGVITSIAVCSGSCT